MNIKIVDINDNLIKDAYFNVKEFFIEYQKNNNKSWWLFLTFENEKELAIEINPNEDLIESF